MPKPKPQKNRRLAISMGVELETYSIALPEYRICRELHFPKRSIVEKGERFTRDWSIGSEYNSKVFTTIRESLFLLKSSLRKYTEFRPKSNSKDHHVIFPIGGWTNRFAGSHIHLAFGKRKLKYTEARSLAACLHDHIPFLMVLSENSPVWQGKITRCSSNRLLLASDKYCKVTKLGSLYKHHFRELSFNRGGKKKPPTLELRICDSSLPEYLAAILCICRAVALRWVKRKYALKHSTHPNYLKARDQAIRSGLKAKLVWNNHWLHVSDYVDLFFRKYEDELDKMDIPDEVIRVFKYLKKGWNQAEVIKRAAIRCRRERRLAWQRQFARRYAVAIQELLDGNSYEQFARRLGVTLPNIDRVWLGRKGANW